MKRTLASQRSLKHLRDNGWSVCSVEKWIPPRGKMKFGIRIDAFGFGDLLACKSDSVGEAIALVQCTALSERQRHLDKIYAIPEFQKWKAAGGTVLLHCWAKRGPRGERKTWKLREEIL